jgi:hypothetical protein
MRSILTALMAGLLLFATVNSAATQHKKSAKTIVRNDNNCESNKAYFDYVATHAGENEAIIVIARLGEGESSRAYNQRRLHNIATYLSYIREIPKTRIVTAEGERVTGRGRVEVYVRGELMIVFGVGRNQDLAGGECEMTRSDLYYPMRRKRP